MGEDLSILELAQLIAEQIGYTGQIVTDTSKPDGTPRKLTDISLIKSTGWNPTTSLRDGLKSTYAAFLNELSQGTLREY
jgi:GDP-L-fucose synthase